MRTLWSVVFVVAACGGGTKSEKTTPDKAAAPAAPVNANAAADAAKLGDEGKQAIFDNNYEDAEVKFRAALALDPKPVYAFDLCVAEFQLGKFADAKTACKTAAGGADSGVAEKATKMLAKIDDEAKKQGIALPP